MGFRFKLSAPLRMCEIAEEREERLLTQILSRRAELGTELSVMQQRLKDVAERCAENLRQPMSAAELQMFYSQKRLLEQAQDQISQQLADCELLRQQQLLSFQTAHQNREVLTELRSRNRENFQKLQMRREQQSMDDVFSSRRRP